MLLADLGGSLGLQFTSWTDRCKLIYRRTGEGTATVRPYSCKWGQAGGDNTFSARYAMAVLDKLVQIPDDDGCALLSEMTGKCELWLSGITTTGSFDRLYVRNANGKTILIKPDYKSVTFKFECFYLQLKPLLLEEFAGEELLSGMYCGEAKAVLRAEWTRPALPDEVPQNHEQVVQRRGRLECVPSDAPACVAMVGVLFVGFDESIHSLVFLDEFPLTLGYTRNSDEIETWLRECWIVSVEEFPAFREHLGLWLVGESSDR